MVKREGLIEQLAKDELRELPVAPKRFRYVFSEDKTGSAAEKTGSDKSPQRKRLLDLLERIEVHLEFAELPEEVKDHPFYNALFRKRLSRLTRDRKAFQNKDRNHARLVSHRPDEDRVQALIEEFAKNILSYLKNHSSEEEEEEETTEEEDEIVVDNIRRVLNTLIRENLETIAKTSIFYMGKNKKGKDILVSTQRVREAVRSVKTQVEEGMLDRENATIAVLLELGAITEKEIRGRNGNNNGCPFNLNDYNLEVLQEEIDRSFHWARTLTDRKMQWITKLIRDFATKGKINGALELPSVNNSLREDNVFDFLDKFFNQTNLGHRDANDIQVILNLTLAHWSHVRFYKSKERLKSFERIKGGILDVLFMKNEEGNYKLESQTGPILVLDEENTCFQKLENAVEKQPVYRVKPMHLPKGIVLHMYSYFMGVKPEEACVMKTWDEDKGIMTPDILTDFFRTRFVLWGINAKQIQKNKNLQDTIQKMLEKVASQLNLSRQKIEGPDTNDAFIKWKLNGINPEGIPVEIQIVPHDSYLFEHAKGSALSHDQFAERRDVGHWKMLIPPSVSKESHAACRLRGEELNLQLEETVAAIKKFDYSTLGRPDEHFQW